MNERNDEQECFEYVTLFGIPALLSEGRVARQSIPQGLYAYDLRGADDDFGWPATLEAYVGVNHAGTLIVAKPIQIPESGYVDIRDQIHYIGDEYTLREFELSMFPERETGAELQARVDGAILKSERETAFLNDTGDAFAIYQLKVNQENRDKRFESFDQLLSRGLHVQRQNYELQYTDSLPPGSTDADRMLDEVYARFNLDRPSDFTGHSVSISDVIVLKLNGHVTGYYVDVFGFRELHSFLDNSLRNAEMSVEDDHGSINNGKRPSVMEQLKQPAKQALKPAQPKRSIQEEIR